MNLHISYLLFLIWINFSFMMVRPWRTYSTLLICYVNLKTVNTPCLSRWGVFHTYFESPPLRRSWEGLGTRVVLNVGVIFVTNWKLLRTSGSAGWVLSTTTAWTQEMKSRRSLEWTSQPEPEIKFLQFNFVSFCFLPTPPALFNPVQLVLIPVSLKLS